MPPNITHQLDNALRLHRAGLLAKAEAAYLEILRKQPNHVDVLNLLGVLRQQTGDHQKAVDFFSKAARAAPRHAPILLNRGQSFRALGRQQDALADFTQALVLDPSLPEAHHQLGNALKSLNRHADAVFSLRRAAEFAPKNAAVWLNLGVSQLALSLRNEAIESFQKALALEPNRPEALNILGSALLDAGRIGEARQQLQRALSLKPEYSAAHDNLGRVLRAQGRAAEALAEFRTALAAQAQVGTHSNLVYALNFVPGLKPAEIFAEHTYWAKLHAAPFITAPPASIREPDPARRLRIGYISPDFLHHAVPYFIEPVLATHNRSQVEVFCYADVPAPDAVTARLRSLSEHWREIAALNDDQVAELIRTDKIDVLVDLAGHTAHNRLLVFARRPAPVQITWIGYPNTTGLDAMQYRLTDAITDPPGLTEAFHSEKLVRLPGPFSCYRPPEEAPEAGPLPTLENGYVTFGCFNHLAKINPGVLDLWARLLVRLPTARLFLKARGLADPETAARVREAFGRQGVDEARIDLCSEELSVAAHLALYQGVDIAIDPFPYNGTTTTCEALWMGVPVVTLAGQSHVSRVTTSLLTYLERTEWIGKSEEEYIGICLKLAADLPRLSELRAAQRERMRRSPICDAVGFTAQLETTYRELWRQHCAVGG